MNHIIHFLLFQLDPKEKVKISNTLIFLSNCGSDVEKFVANQPGFCFIFAQ
jgi:hypothetical protein